MSLLSTAQSLVGTPYVFGGPMGRVPGNTSACDCSGFVSFVFGQNGVSGLPAFTDAMYPQTQPVSDPQPGDLIFYRYADVFQPGTQFPHVDMLESGETAIGCKAPEGVSEHHILNLPHEFRRVPGSIADDQGAEADQATQAVQAVADAVSGAPPWLLIGVGAAVLILLRR